VKATEMLQDRSLEAQKKEYGMTQNTGYTHGSKLEPFSPPSKRETGQDGEDSPLPAPYQGKDKKIMQWVSTTRQTGAKEQRSLRRKLRSPPRPLHPLRWRPRGVTSALMQLL
jgi:hypothetical protein